MRKILAAIFLAFNLSRADGFEEEWLKVFGAEMAGDCELASEVVSQIEKRALEEGRSEQWIYAFAVNYRLLPQVGEFDRTTLLPVFADFVNSLSGEVALLGNLAMAHFYRSYYEDNFKAIDARGRRKGASVGEWNRTQFHDAVFSCFGKLLAGGELLKTIPAQKHRLLFERDAGLFDRCPTLFDIALQDMIGLCALLTEASAAAGAKAVFAPVDDFIEAHRRLEMAVEPFGRALALYAQLLDFHRLDKDLQTFAFCDLSRLGFCARFRATPEDRKAYVDALEQFIAKWRRFEVSAEAAALRAEVAMEEADNAIAGLFASRAIAAFPDSKGAKRCRAIVDELEKSAFELSVPGRWSAKGAKLSATYKNIEALYFRVIPIGRRHLIGIKAGGMEERDYDALLEKKALKEWKQILPPSVDNVPHSFEFPSNVQLPMGHYLLQVSTSERFEKNGQGVMLPISVTDFSLAIKPYPRAVNGVLMNPGGSEQKRRVVLWELDEKGFLVKAHAVSLAAEGVFQTKVPKAGRYVVVGGNPKNEVISEVLSFDDLQEGGDKEGGIYGFLVDRHRVAPGGRLYFSGILAQRKVKAEERLGLAGALARLEIVAPSGKSVKRAEVTAGTNGVFRGCIVLPDEMPLGRYHLRCGEKVLTDFEVGEVEEREEERRRKIALQLDLSSEFATLDSPVSFCARLEGGASLRGDLRGRLDVLAVEVPTSYHFDELRDGDWKQWKTGSVIASRELALGKAGMRGTIGLEPGVYELALSVSSGDVGAAEVRRRLYVHDLKRNKFALPLSSFAAFSDSTVEVGEKISVFWGSRHEAAAALVVFEQEGKILACHRIDQAAAGKAVDFTVKPGQAGFIDAQVLFHHAGAFYSHHRRFRVLPKGGALPLEMASPVEKMLPGRKGMLRVKVAEPREKGAKSPVFLLRLSKEVGGGLEEPSAECVKGVEYEEQNRRRCLTSGILRGSAARMGRWVAPAFVWRDRALPPWRAVERAGAELEFSEAQGGFEIIMNRECEELQVPELSTGAEASVYELGFVAPEREGLWQAELVAIDRDLRQGKLSAGRVSVYAPLFMQENFVPAAWGGDEAEFVLELANREARVKRGVLTLSICEEGGAAIGKWPARDFEVGAEESVKVKWSVLFPARGGKMRYSVELKSEDFSEVKTGRIEVFEKSCTAPMARVVALLPGATEQLYFPFTEKARCEGRVSVTVGNCANQVLEELLERALAYEGDCCEKVFARYFAGKIAAFLGKERAWLKEKSGGEELDRGNARSLELLHSMRLANGTWPWQQGGRESIWTTLRILIGFGRLQRLTGGKFEVSEKTIRAIDRWCVSALEVRKSAALGQKEQVPSFLEVLYLYARSLYREIPFAEPAAEAAFLRLWKEAELAYEQLGAFSRTALALAAAEEKRTELAKRIVEKQMKEFEGLREYSGFADALLPLLDEAEEGKGRMLARALERGVTRCADEGVGSCDLLWALAGLSGKALPVAKLWFWERELKPKAQAGGYFCDEVEVDNLAGQVGLLSAENGFKEPTLVMVRALGAAEALADGAGPLSIERTHHVFEQGKWRLWDGQADLEAGGRVLLRSKVQVKRDLSYVVVVVEKPPCAEVVGEGDYFEGASGGAKRRFFADRIEYVFERMPKGEFVLEQELEFPWAGSFYFGASSAVGLYDASVFARGEARGKLRLQVIDK